MKRFLAALSLFAALGTCFAANPAVELHTNHGVIVLELYEEKAPESVANFLQYARDGHYDDTVFHRVIDGFMIQGGGFDADLKQKRTRAPIENEARNAVKNRAGTIAMARTGDPHSATAQFFINLEDNTSLDYPKPDGWGYAVFGEVRSGMDVVRKIASVPTRNVGPHQNVPAQPVRIETVRIIAPDEAR